MTNRTQRWARLAGKALLWMLGIYLGLMLLLTASLSLFRKQIVAKVVTTLDAKLQGRLTLGDVDVSLWNYFPKVGVELRQVAVYDSVYKAPFARADLLAFRIGLLDVLGGGNLRLASIKASGVVINSITDVNGYSNAYVLRPVARDIPTQDQPKAKKQWVLASVTLSNVLFRSRHAAKQKDFHLWLRNGQLTINDADAKAWRLRFRQDALVHRLGFNMARGAWLKNKTIAADWNAVYYPQESKIIVEETPVRIGPQRYDISAVFNFNDSGLFSIKVNTDSLQYKEGVSLLADNVQRKLNQVSMKAPLHVDAVIEGALAYKTDPKVRVNFVAMPGPLTTPVVTMDSVAFYGHYYNERIPGMGHKDDNSEVVLQRVYGKWGPVLLQGDSVVMTNLKNPNLRFHFTSLVQLARLDEKLEMRTLRIDGGQAKLDLSYDGPILLNADALGDMTARVNITNGQATYLPRNLRIERINGQVLLAQNLLELNRLSTTINGNQLVVDLLARQVNQALQGQGKSRVDMQLFSPRIDLQTMSGLLARRKGGRQRRQQRYTNYPLKQVDDILEKGTLALQLRINQLVNDRLQASNVRGELLFIEDDLRLRRLSMEALGGRLLMDAELKRRGDGQLDLQAHTNVQKVNVARLFYAFRNFGQDGITDQHLEGVFSTKAAIKAVLSQSGKLMPQSVDGRLDFTLENGALKNHQGIQNIKKFIFKKRDLSNIQFARVHNELLIRNDTVYVPRMEVYSSALLLFVEGKYGLKGGTDLSVQLPLSNLKNKEDEFNEEDNIGADTKVGPSVWFRARQQPDGQFKFGLDVFKKLRRKQEIPTAAPLPDSTSVGGGKR